MGFGPKNFLFTIQIFVPNKLIPKSVNWKLLILILKYFPLNWSLLLAPGFLVEIDHSFCFEHLTYDLNLPSYLNVQIAEKNIVNWNRRLAEPIPITVRIKLNKTVVGGTKFKTFACKAQIRAWIGHVLKVLRSAVHRWNGRVMADLFAKVKELSFFIIKYKSFPQQRIKRLLESSLI